MTPIESVVARALNPALFSDDEMVRHRAASPLRVDAAQARVLETARAAIAAHLSALEAEGMVVVPRSLQKMQTSIAAAPKVES